jgi:tripartite-type tricarboxylate transporter receptor subunit TctC
VKIWIGLLAPAATPPSIVEKSSRAASDALNTAEVRDAGQQRNET